MSDRKKPPVSDPPWVVWRGDLLARAALAFLPGMQVQEPPSDSLFDLRAEGIDGTCLLIAVRAYSAMHRGWRDVATQETIEWPVERALLESSGNEPCGAVLFLFDADAGAGRFLRLDGLPIPAGRSRTVTYALPRENAITTENLERLVRSFGRRPAA